MADPTTPVTGASSQSQQTEVESPEVVAARSKAKDAGYARNRAEANYNSVRKEKGENCAETKAAKEELEKAQAQVEKSQAELRALLNPPKRAVPHTAPAKSKAPAEQAAPAPTQKPKGEGAFIIEHEYIKLRPQYQELIRVLPKDKILHRQLEDLLKRIQKEPKSLEYYRKQLNRGEPAKPLNIPQGEVLRLLQEAGKS